MDDRERLGSSDSQPGAAVGGDGAAAATHGGCQAPPKGVRIAVEAKGMSTSDSHKRKSKVKSHSIHGMSEDDKAARPHRDIGVLTFQEKKFLLAVERGDVATVRTMVNETDVGLLDINCCDPLGRSALLMAIDNENFEMVELLLDNKVETKDALLHAIHEEYVEAVELLLTHEENVHIEGEPHSWEAISPDAATFTPDITPLVLAAHRDNYEIIKILLDKGATLPMPHDVRCGCDECMTSRQEDSLRHSRSRINSYRALASPSLIALSSKDPILTAFELSWELRRLSFAEHEFKSEYLELRNQCQKFATALLDHTRSSSELEILLNHDPTGPVYQHGERMHLNRLKLAIKYRQKKFVAHPNVQQLLASIWYEGLPGFRQMNMILQFLEVCRIGLLFPFFSLAYIICPRLQFSQKLRKPFIKFICTSSSYFTFLFLLILASQRIEVVIAEWFHNEKLKQWLSIDVTTKRGSTPTLVEWCILAWVAGLIWSEIKQLWDVGLREYVNDMWNVIDFVTNSLYVATIALRIVAYYKVQEELRVGSASAHLPREHWDTWDPMLISEGLFAAANIFSNLKLVYIFSVNPYLGPLQVSLSRMVMDILKFTSLFFLVLFAFSCGANQLLWYYADLEKQRCYSEQSGAEPTEATLLPGNITLGPQPGVIQHDINHCLAWRRFANLWETSQTLFWAIFGLIDLDNFELTGIKEFTRFSGLLMFGSFSVINIIVLLNLLIAMMNHSYQLISVSSEKADIEWKFARSKLWISYFEEGGTVPPPFNIIPTPKSVYYLIKWAFQKLCGRTSKIKKEHLKTRKVRQASERDLKYQSVMRNLVRRYVTQEQRKAENAGVTEDDVNEIKNDISAFRFELIEIMAQAGMTDRSKTGHLGAAGKKNRQKERRLMKGFNLSSGGATNSMGSCSVVNATGATACPQGPITQRTSLTIPGPPIIEEASQSVTNSKRSPLSRFTRFAKLAGGGVSHHGSKSGPGSGTIRATVTLDQHHSNLTIHQSSEESPTEGDQLLPGSDLHASSGTFGRHRLGGDGAGGSRRDKYTKCRNPIQCLNPSQLEICKASDVSDAADEGALESVTTTGGNSSFGNGNRGLRRTFRVDLEENLMDGSPPLATGTPGTSASITATSSTLPPSYSQAHDSEEDLLSKWPSMKSHSEVEQPHSRYASDGMSSHSAPGTNRNISPSSSPSTSAGAALIGGNGKSSSLTSQNGAATPSSLSRVPGLKPSRNSSSGWL